MKRPEPYSYTRIPSSTAVDLSQLPSLPVHSTFSPLADRLNTRQSDLALASVHYNEFRAYLDPWLAKVGSDQANVRPQARQKLLKLIRQQFQELCTDMYDELMRRKADLDAATRVSFLPARVGFHPKRNQARQKLSTLSTPRFEDLCGDVLYELCRRYPECRGEPSHVALTSGPPYDNFPSPGIPNAPPEQSAHFGNTSENPPSGRVGTNISV
ncbi:hypothetical protein BC827DRAFT_1237471 [Russula dissimulans]|nr:hypothetical protein BC827DRAFT_1237471 [Russula dissimulans]